MFPVTRSGGTSEHKKQFFIEHWWQLELSDEIIRQSLQRSNHYNLHRLNMDSFREQVSKAQAKRKHAETIMIQSKENMIPLEKRLKESDMLLKQNNSHLSEENRKLTDWNEEISSLMNSKRLEYEKILKIQFTLDEFEGRMNEISEFITHCEDEIRQFKEGIEIVSGLNEKTKDEFEKEKRILSENNNIRNVQSKILDEKLG